MLGLGLGALFSHFGLGGAMGGALGSILMIALLAMAANPRQPTFYPSFFEGIRASGRAFSVLARGVLGTTATPSYTFQVRLGPTVGSAQLGGTSIGVSAAIVTASGITNKWWELRLDCICTIPGQSTSNCTLSASGYVQSPGGFATPFIYPLEPTTPDTATWTNTIDGSVANYLNISVTSTASSGSNTLTLKHLLVWGWN